MAAAGPRRTARVPLAVAAGVLMLALVIAGVWRATERPASVPDQAAAPGSGPAYANPASCASCHRAIAQTYALTGMARSLSRVDGGGGLRVDTGASFEHAVSERHYAVIVEPGGLVQRRHQIGPGGAETNVVSLGADYVIGSGNHAQTFVHRAPDGRLLQLPLSWYADGGGHWAMSPGYDRPAHLDFRRVIDEGCLSCHNGYPRERPRDEGTGPMFTGDLPEGIDCQRCHGPGQGHLDALAAGDVDGARRAIVHPGKLDRDRQLEVCLQCHLEPTSSPLPYQIRRFDRMPFSYVPGTPLSDLFLYFDHAPNPTGPDRFADKFEIAGAAYRLARSACFQGSEMTCVTCHNPHDVPRGQAAVQHYTAACQTCHPTVHPAGPPRLAGAGPRETCLDCHMPRRRTDDAVHVVMTDHFIQRVRPARDLTAPLQEAVTLAASHYQGEVALYYPPTLPQTADTELYLALAQVQQGSNLEAGLPRLERAIQTHQPARPEFAYELARAYARAGRPAEVIRWSEAALARDAAFAPALKELAGAALTLGQVDRAVDALRRAVALRPDDTHAQADLGNAYLQRQDAAAAIEVLDRATTRDGTLPRAHNTRGLAALVQGDAGGGERQFREAIRIQPDLAEAHSNLANVLAGRQAYTEAAWHFERAVRHDPDLAAARHGFGLVLALQNRPTRAVAELRAAARLEPRRPRIHTDLGDVLAATGATDEAVASYQRAIDVDGRDFESHFALGELLLRMGQRGRAVPHFEAAATSPDAALREAARARLSAQP